MTNSDKPPFKEWFIDKFKKWEDQQPDRRSSISAFARWLSDNSYGIKIGQPLVDDWKSGHIPKTEKYILVLAEKLGDEMFEIVDFPRPNPYMQRLNRVWEHLPEIYQRQVTEDAEAYETKNISQQISKTPKRRKTSKIK